MNKQINSAGIQRPEKWQKGNQVYLGKDLYLSYLKSKNWKNKKKKYLNSGLKTDCWACDSNKKIEFHHRFYGRLGWEAMTDIVTLCRQCHQEVTEFYNKLDNYSKDSLWNTTNNYIKQKRKLNGLNDLSDKLFNDKLLTKPHNVMHKIK